MTLRARLTAWYASVLFVVLALFGFSVHAAADRLLLKDLDAQLRREATIMSLKISTELDEGNDLKTGAQESYLDFRAPGWLLAVDEAQGRRLVASPDFPSEPAGRHESQGAWSSAVDGSGYRFVALDGAHAKDAWRVLIAAPLRGVEREIQIVKQSLLIGIPLAVSLAILGGLAIAGRALEPLTIMAAQASGVTTPVPGFRLAVPPPPDEINALARSFNELLEKLDLALLTQRQFMADAAHELRTPVSIVRTTAEVTLLSSREEPEYRDALKVVAAQSQRLGKMVDEMMTLARADASGLAIEPAAFSFGEVILACLGEIKALSEQRGVTLASEVSAGIEFKGDERLLRQMLLNLLHNAIEHTPPGGRVNVTLLEAADEVTLTVDDTGRGVPSAESERIFERFVRLDPSRTRPGAGLGLPIARKIAEAHGGTLQLVTSESASGCAFLARLPRRG